MRPARDPMQTAHWRWLVVGPAQGNRARNRRENAEARGKGGWGWRVKRQRIGCGIRPAKPVTKRKRGK